MHPEAPPDAGPLAASMAAARREMAEVHRSGFLEVGADEVRIVAGGSDGIPFGARLRSLAAAIPGGVVVLGSGSVPLATREDRRAFVEVAASGEARALTNNRFSADIVALGRAEVLTALPDLETDNALPRWLSERAGVAVADLRARWRLAVDLDGPLDLLLAVRYRLAPAPLRAAAASLAPPATAALGAIDAVARVLADRRAEVLVAGRTGSATLRWLETSTAARVRAVVEERGLNAASPLALAEASPRPRPPASVFGLLLDRDGPDALGALVARLSDAAVVDTRVLLAHRLGPDAAAWPPAGDRFASDLLRPDLVADPWLRALTDSACRAPVPILLGGHTLVGPGLRLVASVRGS
jgi:hypothetical protein